MRQVVTVATATLLGILLIKLGVWMFGIELVHIVIPIVFILGYGLLIALTPTIEVILGFVVMFLIVSTLLYGADLGDHYTSLMDFGGPGGFKKWAFVTIGILVLVGVTVAKLELPKWIIVASFVLWLFGGFVDSGAKIPGTSSGSTTTSKSKSKTKKKGTTKRNVTVTHRKK